MISLPFLLNAMKVMTWGLRLLFFFLLVLFALQNTQPVSLYWFPGQFWEAPQILVLLLFFAAGVLLGVLSMLGLVYRQRRELNKSQRASLARGQVPPVEPPPL